MQEFTDRIAVVTGAAGGIGLGLTRKCLDQGMHVVMADIDETRLAEVARQLRQDSSQDSSLVTVVPTDVSDRASISRLVDVVEGLESEIALVFNNAGVASSGDLGQLWNATHDDWQKLIDVNLWGVINGCMGFLPILMQQSSPSRIVNVASIAGVITAPALAIYTMTKHAVVSLGESLDQQLQAAEASVAVSTVCPGFVRTHLTDGLSLEGSDGGDVSPTMRENLTWFEERVRDGTDPAELADRVFEGITHERRYIFTHSGFRDAVVERFDTILADLDSARPHHGG
ncbi:MAG: SDR family NAD(P)-dependent oxidoreductase [Candidatus Latescibacterota bacterium]|nr:SDR family NAD(P)-dependent oxidoreductase [Candidatus Latescibacterota bacterium]